MALHLLPFLGLMKKHTLLSGCIFLFAFIALFVATGFQKASGNPGGWRAHRELQGIGAAKLVTSSSHSPSGVSGSIATSQYVAFLQAPAYQALRYARAMTAREPTLLVFLGVFLIAFTLLLRGPLEIN